MNTKWKMTTCRLKIVTQKNTKMFQTELIRFKIITIGIAEKVNMEQKVTRLQCYVFRMEHL